MASKNWPSFNASYKNGTSTYQIEVKNPAGVSTGVEKISVDGVPVDVATGVGGQLESVRDDDP